MLTALVRKGRAIRRASVVQQNSIEAFDLGIEGCRQDPLIGVHPGNKQGSDSLLLKVFGAVGHGLARARISVLVE